MIDRSAFFSAVRKEFGPLVQPQVTGYAAILDEAEKRGTALNPLAYMLATAFHETARTMQPIREYGNRAYFMKMYDRTGSRPAVAKRLGNTVTGDGATFCGRGYVQLTGRGNYARASQKLGEDFVQFPDLVMQPGHAARIMFEGMEAGWFTTIDLSDTIDDKDESDAEDLREFVAARAIINGKDRAKTIGEYALAFERALKAGGYGRSVAAVRPSPQPSGQTPPPPDIPAAPHGRMTQPDEPPVTAQPSSPPSWWRRLLRWIIS